jgi:TolB protein
MRFGIYRMPAIFLLGCLAQTSAVSQSPPEQYNDMFATWSPDGKQIAFTSDRSGDPEIYTAKADGSGLRRLTSTPGRDAHPSWSRDGRTLFFQSPREQGNVRIFSMRADGRGQRSLAKTSGFCGVAFQSPARQEIVFQCSSSSRDFGSGENPWRIYLLRPRQSKPRALTFGPGNDQVATWSPDGRRILFFSDRTGTNQLFELTFATGKLRQITFGPASHSSASYAPDGVRIALMRSEPGKKADVFVLTPPAHFVRITQNGPEFGTPMFSPDGRILLFQMPTPTGWRLFVAPADGSATPTQVKFRY